MKYFLSREGWPMSRVKYWGHYWCLLTQCFLYLELLKKKGSCISEIYFLYHWLKASQSSHPLKLVFHNQNQRTWRIGVHRRQTDTQYIPRHRNGDNQVFNPLHQDQGYRRKGVAVLINSVYSVCFWEFWSIIDSWFHKEENNFHFSYILKISRLQIFMHRAVSIPWSSGFNIQFRVVDRLTFFEWQTARQGEIFCQDQCSLF